MTVERAKIIKNVAAPERSSPGNDRETAGAKRVLRVELEAKERAEAIVRAASAKVEEAARAAREHEIARVAAEIIAQKSRFEEKLLDQTIALAVLLAERLVGDVLAIEPARIRALATEALAETRGARALRVEACREDVSALEGVLASLDASAFEVVASEELARGSLVVHTELGRIDARLRPQLERLAEALRETLKSGSALP